MLIIKAKVLGTNEFTNKKTGEDYRVVYVAFKSNGVNGLKTAQCYIEGDLPKVNDEVSVIENGKYTNIIENNG